MPRSTAQITGCSIAAAPNGQWFETMRELAALALGVGGEAVRGQGVGDRVERGAERPLPSLTGHREGHGAAVLDADLLGHLLRLVGRQQGQRAPEQGEHDIVGADRYVERHLGRRGSVVLRRPARSAVLASLDDHVEVAAGGELVEVVTGDVRVELEPLGHVGGGDAARVLVSEQVDLATSGVAECARDRGDDRRELAWSECRRVHAGILPIRVVQILCEPEPLHAHVRAGHRGAATRRRS